MTDAPALAVTLTNAAVFVGAGATLNENGTALDVSDDSIDDANAVGISASVSQF